jgi:Flp pilus assembly pilin Flp
MVATISKLIPATLIRDTRGQDLTEYALLGGFFAIACVAVFPDLSNNVFTIFSKVVAMLALGGDTTAPAG